MNNAGIPIKLIKKDDADQSVVQSTSSAKKSDTDNQPHKPIEPHVQLVEVTPGVYDIIFTCKCGEKTTIRCNSLELPSTPAPSQSPSTKKPAPPDEESAA